MAKRKKRGGKKRSKARKNPNRVRAAKKAYAKMKREGRGIAAHHKRGGKKRKGYGKKKRKSGSKHKTYAAKRHGMTMQQKLKVRQLTARLVARGYTKQEAESKIRHLATNAAKDVAKAKEKAAQKAANQSALANMFAGFGMAGKAAQVMAH